ncbi:NUDIX domain-containing protein [Mucilaginibacter antarcticus]
MEFGAMLCKPKNPACGICPIRLACYAFKYNATAALPVKLKKLSIKQRFINYFLFTNGDEILMNKRGEGDIWANMYDLPMVETSELLSLDELLVIPTSTENFGHDVKISTASEVTKHILTHQHLYIRFITLTYKPVKMSPNWVFVKVENLQKHPLPKPLFIFLDNFLN